MLGLFETVCDPEYDENLITGTPVFPALLVVIITTPLAPLEP